MENNSEVELSYIAAIKLATVEEFRGIAHAATYRANIAVLGSLVFVGFATIHGIIFWLLASSTLGYAGWQYATGEFASRLANSFEEKGRLMHSEEAAAIIRGK